MTAQAASNPFDNPQFRKELRETLDEKFLPLAELTVKVEEHERLLRYGKGVIGAVLFLWSAFVVAAETLLHRAVGHR
jgi:hypothetical protein